MSMDDEYPTLLLNSVLMTFDEFLVRKTIVFAYYRAKLAELSAVIYNVFNVKFLSAHIVEYGKDPYV